MSQNTFVEVEHKFILEPDFDLNQVGRRLEAAGWRQGPQTATTSDTYFVVGNLPGYIFRHRMGSVSRELTVKSRGGDTETRREVNLALRTDGDDQASTVLAFMDVLGVRWRGTLSKRTWTWRMSSCEVSYQVARCGHRELRVLELEAAEPTTEGSLGVISTWEAVLGLAPAARCRESLFDLLLLPEMRAELGEA